MMSSQKGDGLKLYEEKWNKEHVLQVLERFKQTQQGSHTVISRWQCPLRLHLTAVPLICTGLHVRTEWLRQTKNGVVQRIPLCCKAKNGRRLHKNRCTLDIGL